MINKIKYEKARKERLKAGARVLSERTKYLKETEKREKRLTKEKEKKRKTWQKLKKELSKPLKSKSILKQNQASVTIRERQAPSILGDPNRFFKDKEEDAEMQYFFR